jgi:hypothetical protein
MASNQRMVKLPLDVLRTILQTETKIDKFLAKQAQKWEIESLV